MTQAVDLVWLKAAWVWFDLHSWSFSNKCLQGNFRKHLSCLQLSPLGAREAVGFCGQPSSWSSMAQSRRRNALAPLSGWQHPLHHCTAFQQPPSSSASPPALQLSGALHALAPGCQPCFDRVLDYCSTTSLMAWAGVGFFVVV